MGITMQETIVEGKVIPSNFWHKFHDTNGNVCQKYEGIFIKAGQASVLCALTVVWDMLAELCAVVCVACGRRASWIGKRLKLLCKEEPAEAYRRSRLRT